MSLVHAVVMQTQNCTNQSGSCNFFLKFSPDFRVYHILHKLLCLQKSSEFRPKGSLMCLGHEYWNLVERYLEFLVDKKIMLSDFAILIIILGVVENMNLPTILSRPLVFPPKVCCEQSEWTYNLYPSISSLDGNVPGIWNFSLSKFVFLLLARKW